MGFLRKRSMDKPATDAVDWDDLADDEAERYPALVEFLSSTKYPDGSGRVPGSVSLFVDQGKLKACLVDKDQSLVGFVTVTGLRAWADLIEAQLQCDQVDWRASRASKVSRK
jgi:hypothetical protein